MARTVDVIIIGAGVIGAATVFEMAKTGKKVLSIDKNPAAGYGPTSGSCAIIRVHYSTLPGTAFAYEGYFYWRDWASYLGVEDESGLANFRQVGCLVMQTAQNDYMKAQIEHCNTLNIPYEIWNGDQIKERMPVYDLNGYWPRKRMEDVGFGESTGDTIKSGVYFPTAGYVTDPQLSTHNLQRAAEAHGAEFLFNRQVVEILKTDGRASGVRLDNGIEIKAPVVINVAGPASSKINAMAGVLGDMTITTRPLRQEVVHVPSPKGFDFENLGTIVSDSDISCYCRPEQGNHILIGSEDPECDPREWVDDENYSRDFTDQWTTQAHRYAQRVPSLGIPGRMQGVVDLYDVTEDWIPIYDKSSLPGFYMAIGTSGNQFKNAPIAGKMMASLIDYCEGGHDHDTTPLQFDLPYIGQSIDVGFYSRSRIINSQSSFSVLG
jgi:glycine/D-amino acid oxidase-like deaminating enzyme